MGEAESRLARTLAGGHAPSIANAVIRMIAVREEVFNYFVDVVNSECSLLCQKEPSSNFRNIPVNKISNFKWEDLVEELKAKSPLLWKILTAAAIRADPRCSHKPMSAHYPGIINAAAVLLKERNREMCGLQSVVSLLMCACHCEKQVTTVNEDRNNVIIV